jgi:hypothetical protein
VIDYEKLKIAHELVREYAIQKEWDINLSICFDSFDKDKFGCILSDGNGDHKFSNLDDLIAMLQYLTKPKSKYHHGQAVWFLEKDTNTAKIFTIWGIVEREDGFYYDNAHENSLYPSREALIDAQVTYWIGMRLENSPLKDKVNPGNGKTCPKCKRQRFADGMCWHVGCDYKECQHNFNRGICINCGEFY